MGPVVAAKSSVSLFVCVMDIEAGGQDGRERIRARIDAPSVQASAEVKWKRVREES